MKKRVLQGMRPTGRLHLGNYLGTAKGMVALQEDADYETFYMVADLHGMTTPFDSTKIGPDARNVIIDYLSVGLDPEKSAIFIQSQLADLHTQLSFYFATVVSVARMRHLPTFKEKVKQHPDNVTLALLNYPVLMAADILLYKASMVPVGIDQEPHMEVTREIARKMNDLYGMDFPEPTSFQTKGRYVPSISGKGKMSKSVEGSFINLTDDLATIEKRLAKVPTDSGKGVIEERRVDKLDHELKIRDARTSDGKYRLMVDDSGKVSLGVMSLLTIVELIQGEDRRKQYEAQYSGSGIKYSELKKELAEAIHKSLSPIQEKRRELEADPEYVEKVIEDGAKRARAVAEKTVAEVKEKMGLR